MVIDLFGTRMVMNNLKVAVDVDGVILDIITPFCDYCNVHHGTQMTINDAIKWGFYVEHGIAEDLAWKIFDQLQSDLQNIELIDCNCIPILREMKDYHIVDIVTVRKGKRKEVLKLKLRAVGIHEGTHYRKVVTVSHDPPDVKATYGYDIYIDDNPHLVDSIKENGSHLILYDQPWNERVEEGDNVIRARRWSDIPPIIERIISEDDDESKD